MAPRIPLVGRQSELEVLRQAVASLPDEGRVLFLRGETGAGKTRLVREVVDARADVRLHEDLHLATASELDSVAEEAARAVEDRFLLLGTYDDTGLPRDHPLRILRAGLRRTGGFDEVKVGPLAPDATAALVRAVAGEVPDDLVSAIHRTTGGLAFFVQEVALALDPDDPAVPLPESITDAVLTSTQAVRGEVSDAVDTAAVLGDEVDLDVLAALVGPPAVDRLLEAGLLVEGAGDVASFRHALVSRALRSALPWSRRRALHLALAQELAGRGAPGDVVADHWLGAGRPDEARPLLVAAARQRCDRHELRDAAVLARRALALWPQDSGSERVEVLEGLADCVERSGEPAEAVAVWEEVAEARRALGDAPGLAQARRRLANAAELSGDADRVAAARAAAAEAFAAAGDPAAAATERLALAELLSSRGRLRDALGHVEAARAEAEAVGPDPLRARALTLEGAVRAGLGQHDDGLRLAREGLDMALRAGDGEAVGVNYYELASALLYTTDYTASADTFRLATDYCREQGIAELGHACLACMSVAVRCHGDWDRALEICRVVLQDPHTNEVVRAIAREESGLITALRGGHRRARPTLRRTLALGCELGIFGVEVGSAWGLAVVAAANGDATDAIVDLLDRCEPVDDWHFALPALRWAATRLATTEDRGLLARCQRLLSRAATHNSAPKVLSVLAHAGAELAMLDDAPAAAVDQFARSVELLGQGGSRYELALATYRWGIALGAAGQREDAVEQLVRAYRSARQLGARPLAHDITCAIQDLGESVDRRLGRMALRSLAAVPLTAREQQVLRSLAAGRTNRAIADELVVSVRTVDMHVRNILQKLDCPTRTAAGLRARELGLLSEPGSTATAPQPHGNPAAALR